jgi:hypothetical protein
MIYRICADLVVAIHFLFILFVIFGGLLVLKRWWVGCLHAPAVIWGAAIEFRGWICPLTPLENWLRSAAERDTYTTGFISHYITPLVYPAGLTRSHQFILGSVILILNFAIYGRLIYSLRRQR